MVATSTTAVPLRTNVLARAAIAVAVAWAAVPVVLLAYHTVRYGGVVSGADGPLAGADQLFYMDSIRQSGEHLLITDHFDLVIGHAVFLNPLDLLGGLLWRLGISVQAAFWALKLLAAPLLALGAIAVAARTLSDRRQQAIAVALGLFYFSPLTALLEWTQAVGPVTRYELLLPAGEGMPAWQLWGYPHAGVATGGLALGLLGAVSIARGSNSWRLIAGISAAACIAAWLHPWQGATMIVVLAVLVAQGRSRRLAIALGIPALAAALPLIYEEILVRADAAWRVDSIGNGVGHDPTWTLLVALAPLAIPAVAGIRRIARGPLRTVLVAWPVAALAVYFGTNQFPYHALQGISIPLAVLAVAGWRGVASRVPAPWRTWLALALTLVAVIPGAAYELHEFRAAEASGAAPYFLTAGERAALAYLDHAPRHGGVFSRAYLGSAVPAFTGRRTWVGEWTWTPDYGQRAALAQQLMAGQMPPAQARTLVASTGARFALTDCGARAPLGRLLGPLVLSTHRFGCAAVYALR
jgi:hypothetical protein